MLLAVVVDWHCSKGSRRQMSSLRGYELFLLVVQYQINLVINLVGPVKKVGERTLT